MPEDSDWATPDFDWARLSREVDRGVAEVVRRSKAPRTPRKAQRPSDGWEQADELAQAIEEELLPVVTDLRATADRLMGVVSRLRELRAHGEDGR
jgi:hypothetical protein